LILCRGRIGRGFGGSLGLGSSRCRTTSSIVAGSRIDSDRRGREDGYILIIGVSAQEDVSESVELQEAQSILCNGMH
jgi:hypothetical protein